MGYELTDNLHDISWRYTNLRGIGIAGYNFHGSATPQAAMLQEVSTALEHLRREEREAREAMWNVA